MAILFNLATLSEGNAIELIYISTSTGNHELHAARCQGVPGAPGTSEHWRRLIKAREDSTLPGH